MEAKKRKINNRKSGTPVKLHNGTPTGPAIAVELETTTKLSTLRKIIGEKLLTHDLVNHEIYLQDILLNPQSSLYEQGVKVSGSVELSVKVATLAEGGRLTIVEIAKNMSDEEMQALGGSGPSTSPSISGSENLSQGSSNSETKEELGISCDPEQWTPDQVYRWMVWVAKEFNLDSSIIKNSGMDGKRLCSLTIEEFFIKMPYSNILWSHLSFLKKLINTEEDSAENDDNTTALNLVINDNGIGNLSTNQSAFKPSDNNKQPKKATSPQEKGPPISTRSHNSGGQIQLWQFLLELLTDADQRDVISWVGNEGEFKFIQPEIVARKWGERKGKPTMNYEKLSRALRYYYDGDMINKVPQQRFVYKFGCNLKEILGYNAGELNKMVTECYEKRRANEEGTIVTLVNGNGLLNEIHLQNGVKNNPRT